MTLFVMPTPRLGAGACSSLLLLGAMCTGVHHFWALGRKRAGWDQKGRVSRSRGQAWWQVQHEAWQVPWEVARGKPNQGGDRISTALGLG